MSSEFSFIQTIFSIVFFDYEHPHADRCSGRQTVQIIRSKNIVTNNNYVLARD